MPDSTCRLLCAFFVVVSVAATSSCLAQALPATAGETLSGKRIVLADAVRGHTAVLVAGFSREGGNSAGDWMKAIHADPAFANVSVFQIAMLAGAPGFIRGMIKSRMKKDVSPADQDRFAVLTEDEQPWKNFFAVATDADPYVTLIGPQGNVLWHNHGAPGSLEPRLKAALP